jgi:hypothetical protein
VTLIGEAAEPTKRDPDDLRRNLTKTLRYRVSANPGPPAREAGSRKPERGINRKLWEAENELPGGITIRINEVQEKRGGALEDSGPVETFSFEHEIPRTRIEET